MTLGGREREDPEGDRDRETEPGCGGVGSRIELPVRTRKEEPEGGHDEDQPGDDLVASPEQAQRAEGRVDHDEERDPQRPDPADPAVGAGSGKDGDHSFGDATQSEGREQPEQGRPALEEEQSDGQGALPGPAGREEGPEEHDRGEGDHDPEHRDRGQDRP